jgi:hypothetical protein
MQVLLLQSNAFFPFQPQTVFVLQVFLPQQLLLPRPLPFYGPSQFCAFSFLKAPPEEFQALIISLA